MTIQPNDQPAFHNKETSQHVSVYQLVTELVELVPATLSSWIMSAYMRQFHPTYIVSCAGEWHGYWLWLS